MAFVIETPNAFEPFKIIRHDNVPRMTIREWVITKKGFVEFPVPTICIINGKAVLRQEWDTREFEDRDIVQFVSTTGEVFTIIAIVIAVAAIALSVAFALMIDVPDTPGEQPASDPVFSTKGQSNQIRLGEPIEVCYGRNRIYPSFASRPYFQYIDNDQYQHTLLCLGQGEYDISAIQIGDSDINDFQEVEYEIIEPGGSISLFPTNVSTSVEAGGQEVFATNEEDYIAPGYVGPFSANASGTDAYKIELDIVFPKGLYRMNDDGRSTDPISVTMEIDYREIDDAGAPVGAGTWLQFTTPYPFVFTGETTTPQRRTISKTVTPGRYEVRMRRPTTKTISHKVGNSAVWEGMRAFLEGGVEDYGDVTLLAIRIRASNNLNDRTSVKFNVISTRKLPIPSLESDGSVTWSAPTATRSIVWAFVDVYRAEYGGRVLDNFFDWDTLFELDELYTSRDEHFDWIFRDPITCWEAAKAIARVGRATPLLVGSLLTLKRDGPASVPVTLFTPENIIAGTFQHNIKLWEVNEYDSVRVEYTEPDAGYKQQPVVATIESTTDNPRDIRIPGIQDRQHAYREGLFLMAQEFYNRENYTFDTGLEGHIVTFGDLIAIAHDVPDYGQFGYVLQAEKMPGDDYQVWVSEPLNWDESGDHVISFRSKTGGYLGPYQVRQTNDPSQIIIEIPEDSDAYGEFDWHLGGGREPLIFCFGVSNFHHVYAKVARVEPQGDEIIRITAVNYAPEIYDYDELETDPYEPPTLPPEPADLPEVEQLVLSQIDTDVPTINVSWRIAPGALYYVIQSSRDGEVWSNEGTSVTTSFQFVSGTGTIYVRVAAVNVGQGPWIEDTIEVVDLLGLSLEAEWTGLEWTITWTNVLNVTGWRVEVFDAIPSTPVLERTEEFGADIRTFTYDYTDATTDVNLNRQMLVRVTPIFTDGDGDSAELELENPIPAPADNFSATQASIDSAEILYDLQWDVPEEDDLIQVKVWLSPVLGFDPDLTMPIFDDTAGSPGWAGVADNVVGSVPLDSGGGHPAYYWRVAVFDVWGNELDTNLSAEQVIPAYP